MTILVTEYLLMRYFRKQKIHLKMDVSTGDVVVPDAIDYNLKCIFEDKSIQIKSLETVLEKGIRNRPDQDSGLLDLTTFYNEIDYNTK